MKKLVVLLSTAAIPFLLVWAAFVLTGFSFNPINVFQDGAFWGVSVLYWFLWVCICPLIIDGINEVYAHNKKINEKIRKEKAIEKHLSQYPEGVFSTEDIEWARKELKKTI